MTFEKRRSPRLPLLISALLLLCVCTAWIGSYFATCAYPQLMRETGFRICSSAGRLNIQRLVTDYTPASQAYINLAVPEVAGDTQDRSLSGKAFNYRVREIEGTDGIEYITCPSVTFPRASPKNAFGFGCKQVEVLPVHNWFIITTVSIPYWSICAITLIIPLLRMIAWHRESTRLRAGRCAVCGYDRRESPSRCPECGNG